MAKFYITNAIPYVNAKPHIGHALEFVQSDTIARYHKLMGDETLLLCGSDENAIKNVQAAEKAHVPIQEFVDKNSELFENLAQALHVQFDVFQKGSSNSHHESSQKLWNLCSDNGDIYKKTYTGLYCVGCELFYERSELNENGECYEHPGKPLEEVSEENYFFRLSKYQKELEHILETEQLTIIPEHRKNEVLSFVKQGLKDISISRTSERAKHWGVQVPNDPNQRMYVWFDALNIYQSGIGFGWDEKEYQKWWPAGLHVIGKGIIRFHAVYWIAFLLSAKLKLPKALFVHGYFTVNGQKMSKTIGNVIDPIDMINKYGNEGLRYFLLKEIAPTGDGDFAEEKLKEVYNADLANGLGNLISRVAKLCETANFTQAGTPKTSIAHLINVDVYEIAMNEYRFNDALFYIWQRVAELNRFIDQEKPWELIKKADHRVKDILAHLVDGLQEIAVLLKPFLPKTSQVIAEQFKEPVITSQKPLFPRVK